MDNKKEVLEVNTPIGEDTCTIELKVGNDTGNSEHKIIINGNLIRQPNVISRVRSIPILDDVNEKNMIEHIEDNLIVKIMSNNEDIETGTYLIGKYALNSGNKVRSIEIGQDNDKADSAVLFISTLAHIAGYSVKEAYKNNKLEDKIIANIDMCGALPITQHNKAVVNKLCKKFMEDSAIVKVVLPSKTITVELNFDFVNILPEGVTTVFALTEAGDELFESYNKSNEDNLNKEYFKDKRALHISIGEGTTEYPVTEGKSYRPEHIKGSDNGLGIAINKCLPEFMKSKGVPEYTRQKFSEVIRDKEHKYHVSASEILDFYIDDQSEEILICAKGELQKANNEVDIILVYGGGSILMKKYLEPKLKKICNRAEIKLLYIDEKYAVILECIGLFNFVNSKVWEAIKKRSLSSLSK
ncbi:TPA: ParM/StbA family protein [Clostridioides difficile]|nr:ParM/StbA family protein [Clostridioides difficile]